MSQLGIQSILLATFHSCKSLLNTISKFYITELWKYNSITLLSKQYQSVVQSFCTYVMVMSSAETQTREVFIIYILHNKMKSQAVKP